MLKIPIVVVAALFSCTLFAQEPQSSTGILDPSDPTIAVRKLSEQQLLEEIRRRQLLSEESTNDLDGDQIDKLVLDTLTYRILTEPRIVQAQLDFSDIQFARVSAILNSLRSSKLEFQANQIDVMCSQWKSSASVPSQSRVIESLGAFEDKGVEQSHILYSAYQQALTNIRVVLGPANSEIFDSFIDRRRAESKHATVYSFQDSVQIFGNPEESIESNCKEKI